MPYRMPPDQMPQPGRQTVSIIVCAACGVDAERCACEEQEPSRHRRVEVGEVVFLRVSYEIRCCACNFDFTHHALPPDTGAPCPHCGIAQRVPTGADAIIGSSVLLSRSAAKLHEAGILLSLRDTDIWVESNGLYYRCTIDRPDSVRLGGGSSNRIWVRVRLGHPLCTCGNPLWLASDDSGHFAHCAECDRTLRVLRPSRHTDDLVGSLAPDADLSRQAEVTGTTTIALRCANCAGSLTVAEGSHSTTCPHCKTQCWIPQRFWSQVDGMPRPDALWLIFALPASVRAQIDDLRQADANDKRLAEKREEEPAWRETDPFADHDLASDADDGEPEKKKGFLSKLFGR